MGGRKGKTGKVFLQLVINYGIPYIIFSVLWVLMKLVFATQTNNSVSIKDLLLIPIYPISFMWFIYTLLIMQALQVFIRNKSKEFKIVHLTLLGGTTYSHS